MQQGPLITYNLYKSKIEKDSNPNGVVLSEKHQMFIMLV